MQYLDERGKIERLCGKVELQVMCRWMAVADTHADVDGDLNTTFPHAVWFIGRWQSTLYDPLIDRIYT